MNGFLVVDKPSGMTSHDVIARLRRTLGTKRIGHAGTLDPSATGILLIGVGRGTRLLRFVEALSKEYRGDVIFGIETSTQDAAGTITAKRDASSLSEEDVERALAHFRGEIDQVPPMVSAIKVGGERLYQKARRGEEVERAPRRVTIHEAEVELFVAGPHPTATLRIECSKGTYIRSIASDLGAAVGTGAHLGSLRRTRIGPFNEAVAVPLSEVTADSLLEMSVAVAGYPRRAVSAEEALAVVQGKQLAAAGIAGPYAVWGPEGLVAMAEDEDGSSRSLCVVTTV